MLNPIFLVQQSAFYVAKGPTIVPWLAIGSGEAELCPESGGTTSDLPGNLLAHLSGVSILGVVLGEGFG